MRAAILALALIAASPVAAQAGGAAQVGGATHTADAQLADPRAAALGVAIAAQPVALAVYVTGDAADYGAASKSLTLKTPIRIASNTKTFVAATVLRLWEQGRIDLDAPIAKLVSPTSNRVLRRDGYDTVRITVRHLLSHSGGLFDHGGDPRFVALLKTNTTRAFTRADLVKLSTEYNDPQSPPGTEFRYSDTGYILLGEVIERITRRDLATAVRSELKLDRIGLSSIWWEEFEPRPRSVPPRARQFIGERDVTDVEPTMDLYGGGGQLASARDLAIFFKALFGGRVFDKPATLKEMLWQGPHQGADRYRLGIFVKSTPAGDIWWHSGFWGSYAAYAPSTGIAIAAVSSHQGGIKPIMPEIEARVLKAR